MLNNSMLKNGLKLFTIFLIVLITTACNNQNELIVNFESNSGSEISSLTFTNNELNVFPDDPVKDDADFDGWYIDQDLNEVFNLDDIETYLTSGSITLYAKWIENLYQISFDSNDGSELESIAVMHGDEIPLLPEPSKDNMFFYGWYEDEDFNIPFSFSNMPKTHLNLYARWSDNIYTYDLNEFGEATLTDYNLIYHEIYFDSPTALSIPDEVDGHPVISLTRDVFDNIKLYQLTLPNSIKTLPMGVFKDLQLLESLTIPFVGESRTAESMSEFNMSLGFMFTHLYPKSNSLNTHTNDVPVTLESVVVTDATQIGFGAFSSTNIRSIVLNEGIISIDSFAFGAMPRLYSINIPSTLETLDPSAFDGAQSINRFYVSRNNAYFSHGDFNIGLYNKDKTKLIKYSVAHMFSYEIPETVTEISSFAFQHSIITSLFIPNSVTRIGIGAFQYTKYLNTVTFEEGSQLEMIQIYAFSYSGIKEIVIPASVKEIMYYAFTNTYELEKVSFESNSQIERIGVKAFDYAISLKTVYIPLGVMTIDQFAFFDNHDVTIYVEAAEKPDTWADRWFEGNVVWGHTES